MKTKLLRKVRKRFSFRFLNGKTTCIDHKQQDVIRYTYLETVLSEVFYRMYPLWGYSMYNRRLGRTKYRNALKGRYRNK